MTQGKEELEAQIKRSLPALLEVLLAERAQWLEAASASRLPSVPEDAQEQWDLFRALVNTRPADPASEKLLNLQDQLLQDILAYRGVTRWDNIPNLPDRSHVKLWRGDITTLATDAIVNAANSQMLGCFIPGHHCIDNAIHTFAGVQLRIACAALMEVQGYPEPTGMAKVTKAFNLPCKQVIHTVGPIAQGAVWEADKALLANCYEACLDAAVATGCQSIAFCCISTGVFGFPQDEAAEIAIRTVDRWLEEHDCDMSVVFNVFSERDETLYRALL